MKYFQVHPLWHLWQQKNKTRRTGARRHARVRTPSANTKPSPHSIKPINPLPHPSELNLQKHSSTNQPNNQQRNNQQWKRFIRYFEWFDPKKNGLILHLLVDSTHFFGVALFSKYSQCFDDMEIISNFAEDISILWTVAYELAYSDSSTSYEQQHSSYYRIGNMSNQYNSNQVRESPDLIIKHLLHNTIWRQQKSYLRISVK